MWASSKYRTLKIQINEAAMSPQYENVWNCSSWSYVAMRILCWIWTSTYWVLQNKSILPVGTAWIDFPKTQKLVFLYQYIYTCTYNSLRSWSPYGLTNSIRKTLLQSDLRSVKMREKLLQWASSKYRTLRIQIDEAAMTPQYETVHVRGM